MNDQQRISKNLIRLDCDVHTKGEAIACLTSLLYDEGIVTNQEKFMEDVYAREKEGITGMGNGVAIPHGKSEFVRRPALAIARTNQAIPWESYDDEPVRLIILLAVPNTKEGMNDHLQMLSEVSKRLAKKEVIERLKEEKDEDRLIRILLNP